MKLRKWLFLALCLILLAGLGYHFIKKESLNQPIKQLSGMENGILQHKELNLPDDRRIKVTLPDMGLQADSVILMNAHHGDILFEKNADEPLPTASMSKMMTEYLVLEAIKNKKITWDTPVTISDYVFWVSNHPGFASVHLNKNQKYTVRELFNAMAVRSANGASIALAEAVAGSEKEFVKQMNAKANELGLSHSQFVNCTGLSNTDLESHYSTGGPNDTNRMSARDVAVLAQKLIRNHPEILKIIDQPKITFQGKSYHNTNWMLPGVKKEVGYKGVDGLKTGYTDEAGYCFVGTVHKNNARLISVVMGAATPVDRFTETAKLYNTAFSQF
ncbi:MAG: D-alanyl-D-alanine carboxypeptidase family protein [Tuberibacillus sp.]